MTLTARLLPILALAGCATVPTDGQARSQVHVGIVRIVAGAGQGTAQHVSVRTLGLGWDGAAFLGWRAADYVRADPAACQILIVVRRTTDMASVARLLNTFEGEKPCVVNTAAVPAPPQPFAR